MAEVIRAELNDAYDALDRLDNYMPTSWDGVGWDGDASNQYGKDCVESKIVASIRRLEKELEEYEQHEGEVVRKDAMMKTDTINGKEYVITPLTRKITIDGGAAIEPFFLEKAKRIEGTNYYKATYKNHYGEEVTRITEFIG